MTHPSRSALAPALRQLGVETITAEYNGANDNGWIDDPAFEPVEVPDETAKAVHDLFYGLLEDVYGGWEIDEGSFGTFKWDVKADSILLEHSARTYSTEEKVL